MKPTLSSSYSQARSLLGDDEIQGGEIFTDTVLLPHASQAIRELFRVLRGAQDPFVLVENYFVLPANVSVFDPATAGITNIPEPEFVEWILSPPPIAITNVIINYGDTPFATVTAPAHGLAVGTFPAVCVYGIQGFDQFNNPNQSWTSQIIDADTVQLNGCNATGMYISDGYLINVAATGQFWPMVPRDRIEPVATQGAAPGQTDQVYAWEGGVFRFLPSGANRLLRITYRQSGMVDQNTNATIPIDDCQDYLATRMAGLAADSRGAAERAAQLKMEAIGPSGQADGNGGLLGQLLRVAIRNLQREQYRYLSFRARRNRSDFLLY